MKEEKCWIKMLRGLNVFPLIVCFLSYRNSAYRIWKRERVIVYSSTVILCNFLFFDLFH